MVLEASMDEECHAVSQVVEWRKQKTTQRK